MVHWKNSYKYGKVQEAKVLPVIKDHFGRPIIATEGQYAKYDYIDDDNNYEVKSRTNKMNTYPTTMITCNKLVDTKKPLHLLFNFTDCLAYIQYDAEAFSKYTTAPFSRLGCCWDEKEHIYIPVEHLTVIKTW
jgi:hypothetical protein